MVSGQTGTSKPSHLLHTLHSAGRKKHCFGTDHMFYFRLVLQDEMKHALALPDSLHQTACRDWLGRGLNIPEEGEFHG